MTTNQTHEASPGYALGQLLRALRSAQTHPDPEVRERARGKIEQWTAVLDGMADGTLRVGSRTPVADTPAWVTLEVAHGGFATGRYLAEGTLREHEVQLLSEIPADVPGETERERLNLFYCSDEGGRRLLEALHDGRYEIEVPEEAALVVAAWLVDNDQAEPALQLLSELRPLMHRLRFYPRLTDRARVSGTNMHVANVGEVAQQLAKARPSRQVTAMNATLAVWNPLYDSLVALWLTTVDGDPPVFADDGDRPAPDANGQTVVQGGWPCRRWPSHWTSARDRWLTEYEAALREHGPSGRHHSPKSNFQILRRFLERCPSDASSLSEANVRALRHALGCAVTRHGVPGDRDAAARRAEQARIAALPVHADIAKAVAARLAGYPDDEGLPALEDVTRPIGEGEHGRVPAGTKIPDRFVAKAQRALIAPVDELVGRGVIGSAEVLAIVLPQITSQIAAAGIGDPKLRDVFARTYAAFRRRRSLLLLDLAHQITLEELPWVAALAPQRRDDFGTERLAADTLREVTLLALSSFPHTIVPNPLIRELADLSKRAGLKLPFVEEIAADIFMGTFTKKFSDAAELASALLEGTLYARYFDLPPPGRPRRLLSRWGKKTDRRFDELCRKRAAEAGTGGNLVARNGAIVEQSQILTTYNLATLVHALDLKEELETRGHELASVALRWVAEHQARLPNDYLPRLRLIKNCAYAWRQAIFFLSFVDEPRQQRVIEELEKRLTAASSDVATRLAAAVAGLKMVVGGERFDELGKGRHGERRLLGWACGRHWLMPTEDVIE